MGPAKKRPAGCPLPFWPLRDGCRDNKIRDRAFYCRDRFEEDWSLVKTTESVPSPRFGLLQRGLEHHVAICDSRVIALQINRAWLAYIGPEGAAGATHDWLIVDNSFAIQFDRHVAIDQSHIQRLPFPCRFLGGNHGLNAAVNRPHIVEIRPASE